jgi:hypothetical protein
MTTLACTILVQFEDKEDPLHEQIMEPIVICKIFNPKMMVKSQWFDHNNILLNTIQYSRFLNLGIPNRKLQTSIKIFL